MPAMSPSKMSSVALGLAAGHWWKLEGAPLEVVSEIAAEY